jgi:hypothetical protein
LVGLIIRRFKVRFVGLIVRHFNICVSVSSGSDISEHRGPEFPGLQVWISGLGEEFEELVLDSRFFTRVANSPSILRFFSIVPLSGLFL